MGVSTYFGNTALVVALHHGGGWVTVYAHLSAVLVDECGQWVGRGSMIGRVGMTGASNFPHLHFEVRQGGLSYNPQVWLE
jgi:murein DD-endopeptidase MepM/ murein hydrolase activator NlpD